MTERAYRALQFAKFYGSKSCRNRSAYLGPARCAYRGQCRSRTWQSHRAAPQASPLVYTARVQKLQKHPSLFRLGVARCCSAVPEYLRILSRGHDPYAVLFLAPWRTGTPLQSQPLVPVGFESPTLWAPETPMLPPSQLMGISSNSSIVPLWQSTSYGCRQPLFRLFEPQ